METNIHFDHIRSVLVRMKNASHKYCREKSKHAIYFQKMSRL